MVVANLGGLLSRKALPGGGFTNVSLFSSDAFAFLLIFTGFALTLVVEFIYLRDSFGVRMNTVFKFYYQAWVMLGCASAYGVWWVLDRLERPVSRVLFSLGAVVMIGLGLVYPIMAIPSRAADFIGPAHLDGSSSVSRNNPDDWAAIQWLDEHALGQRSRTDRDRPKPQGSRPRCRHEA